MPIKKNVLNALLLIALITFALWFALHDDYQQVIENIKAIPIWLVFIVCGLGIIYYLLQGYVISQCAKIYKKDIRVIDGIQNAYVAAFFNGVTPVGGGQVAQSFALKQIGMKIPDIASTLWMDFFMFQIVVIIYAALMLLFNLEFVFGNIMLYFPFIVAGWLINSAVIVALWLMTKFPNFFIKLTTKIINLLHKIRIVKEPEETAKKWKLSLEYFHSEIIKLKTRKKLLVKGILCNIIRMTIFYSIPYVIALGYNMPFDAIDVLHIVAISSFVHMLNALTPLPGDTGFTETMFILMYAVVFHDYAKPIMIIWRLATYYINIIIGACVLFYFRIKGAKAKSDDIYQQ